MRNLRRLALTLIVASSLGLPAVLAMQGPPPNPARITMFCPTPKMDHWFPGGSVTGEPDADLLTAKVNALSAATDWANAYVNLCDNCPGQWWECNTVKIWDFLPNPYSISQDPITQLYTVTYSWISGSVNFGCQDCDS